MAIVKFSPLISEARGAVGDIVFSRNTYGAYVRDRVTPANPDSIQQQLFRGRFATVVAAWSSLSDNQRKEWRGVAPHWSRKNIFGDHSQLSGYGLFMRLNLNVYNLTLATLTHPPEPVPPDPISISSLVLDNGANSYVITLASAVADNTRVQLRASSSLNLGVNFVKSEYRYIAVIQNTDTYSFKNKYAYVFGGSAITGKRVFIAANSVNIATGITLPPQIISAIVTA